MQTIPTSQQIGRKLAKCFAIMRRIENDKRREIAKRFPIRNAMSAFAEWDAK